MKLKKNLISVTVLFLCIGMLFSCDSLKSIGKKTSDTSGVTSGQTEVPELSAIVAETEHYKIDVAMLTYFYYSAYDNLSQYFSILGIDAEKDLREQKVEAEAYSMLTGKELEEEMTWFDFFYNSAVDEITSYVVLSEKALAAGMTISAEETAEINEYLTSLDTYAAENGFANTDEFIYDFIAPGVNKDTVKKCIEIQQLSYEYYQKYSDGVEVTEEEEKAYLESHRSDFLTVDFYYYTAELEGEYETDEEKSKAGEALKSEVEAAVSAIKDKEGIVGYINGRERKDGDPADVSDTYLVTSCTREDLSTELGDWIFDEGRKLWDTKVIEESDFSYSICCVASEAKVDESYTKNVRHILFLSENHTDADGARKAAEELYEEMKKSTITEDSFKDIANEKSEDPGSNTNGGLYENVSMGDMVKEFNDWIFDEARKPGDTGIVDTSYGSHIMYFVGDGLKAWENEARACVVTEKINQMMDEASENSGLNFDKSKAALIPEKSR